MRESDIVITALGMISSVGLNMIQSCASIRAGISGFREWEGYYCQQESPDWEEIEPSICAYVPNLNNESDRGMSLMASALKELVQHAKLTRKSLGDTKIFISVPPDNRPGQKPDLSQRILPEFYSRVGIESFEESKIFSSGHAGVLIAVQEAVDILQKDLKKFCIIVGADSYLETNTLTWLDESGRLKSARNQDAFIPGEGAAGILLETYSHAMERKAAIFASIEKVGTGVEKNTIGSDIPSTGEGLSEAIKAVCPLEDDEEKIDFVVCDLNGESYRSREWGCCLVRLNNILGNVEKLWHPADCIGDVGAATGTIMTVLAARAFQRGYAPSDRALLWTSSDNGDRSAVILKKHRVN